MNPHAGVPAAAEVLPLAETCRIVGFLQNRKDGNMPGAVSIVLLVIILILLFTNIRIVPQAHCFVIERLGKFHGLWEAGIHVKAPFIDRIAKNISLKEQVLDFPPQPVITKDNVTMQIDSVVYARVFDPKLFTYGVENPMAGLQNLTATTLRSIVGEMELDQTLSSRDEATDQWGIKVTRVEVKNIQPPKEIEAVMTKQMRAERERRQTILEAESHQQSVVMRAKGDKEAKELAAEAEANAQISLAKGKAESIRLVYEAQAEGLRELNAAEPTEKIIRLKALEALKDVSDGQATKIYIPNDLADTISSIGVIGDSLSDRTTISATTVPRDSYRKAQAEALKKADPCVDRESTPASKGAFETTEENNAVMTATRE